MKYVLLIAMAMLSGISYALEPFKIFVSPSGSDDNNGLEYSYPIKSLSRAQDILRARNPNQPIEIHISQGTYLSQSVVWSYTNGHSITFTPIDFTNDRPVFDGEGSDTWFKLSKKNGKASNLKFRYIKVQNYNTAMSFEGNRANLESWNSENELYGMYFYRIGGQFSNSSHSTAAVRFVNSKNNSVINSHFVEILNNDAQASAIHALYFAHYSSNNKVLRNRFLTINGDPIKVRDESNYNYIADNKFYSSGKDTFYQEWYCNPSVRSDCTKVSGECPSIGNEFRNNDLYGGYSGAIKMFMLRESDNYCGELSIPRLRTSDNVKYY